MPRCSDWTRLSLCLALLWVTMAGCSVFFDVGTPPPSVRGSDDAGEDGDGAADGTGDLDVSRDDPDTSDGADGLDLDTDEVDGTDDAPTDAAEDAGDAQDARDAEDAEDVEDVEDVEDEPDVPPLDCEGDWQRTVAGCSLFDLAVTPSGRRFAVGACQGETVAVVMELDHCGEPFRRWGRPVARGRFVSVAVTDERVVAVGSDEVGASVAPLWADLTVDLEERLSSPIGLGGSGALTDVAFGTVGEVWVTAWESQGSGTIGLAIRQAADGNVCALDFREGRMNGVRVKPSGEVRTAGIKDQRMTLGLIRGETVACGNDCACIASNAFSYPFSVPGVDVAEARDLLVRDAFVLLVGRGQVGAQELPLVALVDTAETFPWSPTVMAADGSGFIERAAFYDDGPLVMGTLRSTAQPPERAAHWLLRPLPVLTLFQPVRHGAGVMQAAVPSPEGTTWLLWRDAEASYIKNCASIQQCAP